MKRLCDLIAATLGLVVLLPFFFLIAIAIVLETRGPIMYRGERVGKDSRPFRIFKFRTMVAEAARLGGGITHRDDPRVTRVGRVLRKYKLDELPQLINVVRGDMSLVGPRPEDPRYVARYTPRQRQVLSVRPGLTSLASLRYKHEENLLPAEGWEKFYVESVMPAKLDIELGYIEHASRSYDFIIILATLFSLLGGDAWLENWTNAFSRFETWLSRYVSWFVLDVPLILIAFALGLAVRSVNTRINFGEGLVLAVGCVAVYLAVNFFFGIYQRIWRYASAAEVVQLFLSTAAATLIITGIDLALQRRDLPLGAVWMGGFFTFCFTAAARYRRRLLTGARQTLIRFAGLASAGHGARVLIVGAGEEGQLFAWQLQNRLEGGAYEVIGFVDADPNKQGMRIHGVPVLGDRHQIPQIATELSPDLIVIAIPPLEVRDSRELLALCRATNAQVKIMPSLFDWLGRKSVAPIWEDVDERDLLERTPYRVDAVACHALLAGKVVMVTGAAGSIGSELCRQIAGLGAEQMILVDINETGLHDLGIELESRAPGCRFELALADITSCQRMEQFFSAYRPGIVFHVAAYKHVPMLELHPQEAIRVNVFGTRLLQELAEKYGAERFVLISTDKAVNPTNVLGMTKWLGELLVARPRGRSRMRSTAVRFGNVLGSRGSVIPTFEKQIELGGPITITHPEMERYFLTIQEAVSLVIQAASMTQGGDLYVLDMGVPIPIAELAQRLIRAHGLRPGIDVEIRVIGTRPGEKLTEELVGAGEEKASTPHPSIFRICRNLPLRLDRLEEELDALIAFSANGASSESAFTALVRTVQAFTPPGMATQSPPEKLE